MLIFAADINRQRTILGPSRQSRHVIKALFLGTAKVIDDCLSKVIAVSKRFADDLCAPGISRLQAEFSIISATEQSNFPAEFLLESPVEPRRFAIWNFVFGDAIRSLLDLPRTFHARPRTHIREPAMNVAERSQTIHRGVDRAIQRYVRRPHVPRFAAGILVAFAERAPLRDFRIAVLRVGAEDLPADIPPQGAAYDCVRCPVLMPHNPRSAHPSGQAVSQELGQGAGIFVSNHAGNRPTDGSVLGRERNSTLEKLPLSVAGKRAVPSEGVFEGFRIQERVNAGFSTEKSRFAFLIVVRQVSPEEHSSTRGSHYSESGIGSGNRV